MILQRLALDHPDAVRSLILGATNCAWEASRRDIPEPAGNTLRRYANLYSAQFIAAHPEWVTEDATHFGKMPLHAIIRQDEAVRGHDVCGQLGEIRQPVLILHGRQDRMVPLERGQQLLRLLPNARLEVLDPAGHQFHSEQFERVSRLVVDFVEEVERARARAARIPTAS